MKFKVLRNSYLGKVIVNCFGGFPQKSVALSLLSLSPYLILLFIETNKRAVYIECSNQRSTGGKQNGQPHQPARTTWKTNQKSGAYESLSTKKNFSLGAEQKITSYARERSELRQPWRLMYNNACRDLLFPFVLSLCATKVGGTGTGFFFIRLFWCCDGRLTAFFFFFLFSPKLLNALALSVWGKLRARHISSDENLVFKKQN